MQTSTGTEKSDFSPKYNVKAVSTLVGILPVTLRAWERRYGIFTPQRGAQGYRLYSEYDLRTLRWIKAQMESGLSISRAAQHLADLRAQGNDPVLTLQREIAAEQTASPHNLIERSVNAWLVLDEESAAETIRLAFSLYPVEFVLLEIIRPALVELGERWHRGEIAVATEHFASQFCVRHLNSMLAAAGAPSRPGCIVAACAPGEHHEIGLLILVVMLRWRGYDVRYLGQNLKFDRLEEAIGHLQPRLLLITLTRAEVSDGLRSLPEVLARFAHPAPKVIIGGQAVRQWKEDRLPAAVYVDDSPTDTLKVIERLMLHEQDSPLIN